MDVLRVFVRRLHDRRATIVRLTMSEACCCLLHTWHRILYLNTLRRIARPPAPRPRPYVRASPKRKRPRRPSGVPAEARSFGSARSTHHASRPIAILNPSPLLPGSDRLHSSAPPRTEVVSPFATRSAAAPAPPLVVCLRAPSLAIHHHRLMCPGEAELGGACLRRLTHRPRRHHQHRCRLLAESLAAGARGDSSWRASGAG